MPFILVYDMDGQRAIVEVSNETQRKIIEDHRCFVLVSPSELGLPQLLEVSPAIYAISDEARRLKERLRYHSRKHGNTQLPADDSVPDSGTVLSPEDRLLYREQLSAVFHVLRLCSDCQRRRFFLHRILGYSYPEVAHMECCGISRVRKSVLQAERKLKKYFSDNF